MVEFYYHTYKDAAVLRCSLEELTITPKNRLDHLKRTSKRNHHKKASLRTLVPIPVYFYPYPVTPQTPPCKKACPPPLPSHQPSNHRCTPSRSRVKGISIKGAGNGRKSKEKRKDSPQQVAVAKPPRGVFTTSTDDGGGKRGEEE